MFNTVKLPDDPQLLKSLLEKQISYTEQQISYTKKLEEESERWKNNELRYINTITLLREKVEFYKLKWFGTSSEKQPPNSTSVVPAREDLCPARV